MLFFLAPTNILTGFRKFKTMLLSSSIGLLVASLMVADLFINTFPH